MITNAHLYKLMEIPVLARYMEKFHMKWKMCDDYFFIYSYPYVVVLREALTENYLEIDLVDLNESVRISGSRLFGISLDRGLQNVGKQRELRKVFSANELSYFLSEGEHKLGNLYDDIGALDLLFNEIKREGLISFKDWVTPLDSETKEFYLRCITAS
jgi:hypothetical protein